MDQNLMETNALSQAFFQDRSGKINERFKNHLIRSLDILVYCHIVCIYFMDVSFFRLLLRSIIQLNIYTHKIVYISVIPRLVFFYVVIGSFFLCLLCHLLWVLPDAPEGQYGYLHGGLFIDFVGEGRHCKFKPCFFDFIIFVLQLFILSIKENSSDIISDDFTISDDN
ncbi:hypothetical protein T552_00406 [Pneumocystis carinii B80]|uniref:DUF1746 domain-containing protein n=1 Tax=Pneumocystis carinii (strain B80) TaxID=1408658 RepID=A0A0W4ZQP5_PNEC8|nr:hypothetical protein T552_00406 [Pneumocystis carinii B80]KTW30693.1 hypothetical protein T552_00406 [Pneumocystis carinii B80]